jgi:hypothetical protein
MTGRCACGAVGVAVLVAGLAAAAEDVPVVVIDSAGKELKLTGVKWTTGTRRLAWLADPKGETDDARKGPLAVEVREPNSTTYQKGVVTLIPAASVEAIRYDYEKLTVSVSVKGRAEPVAGTIQYRGFSVVGLEGKDGDATVKLAGGVLKTGFKSATFLDAKPLPERKPGGALWGVQIVQPGAKDPTLTVRNLKVLFTFPGGTEQLLEGLPVRKGDPLKLDASVKRLEILATNADTQITVLEVQSSDGPERVVVVPLTLEEGGRTGTLAGFLGEVDVGWKLFPLHTVKLIKPPARD